MNINSAEAVEYFFHNLGPGYWNKYLINGIIPSRSDFFTIVAIKQYVNGLSMLNSAQTVSTLCGYRVREIFVGIILNVNRANGKGHWDVIFVEIYHASSPL